MLPLNLPELEVSGLALVTAIGDCPPIADGEGSVVTARFVTREVHVVASVDVLGADGTVETITGTTIHPVWSVDRQEWVPLAELTDGETLQGLDGLAVVLSVSLSRVSQPVYNIEVHGEHVYQVGELGLVVHNTCPVDLSIVNGNHFRLIDDLLKAGSQVDRNGLTLAGRALQKHGDRVGSVFPKSFGDLSTRNAHGQAILEGILRSAQQTTRANRYGGFDVFNVLTGRGARFDSLGKFIGFLDP
jgi:hypothetical protein